jgi:hypothetical protein
MVLTLRVRRKGNQQAGQAAKVGGYMVGLWFRTVENKLCNLDLAQTIEIMQIDDGWSVEAVYNDASSVLLAKYQTEEEAQQLIDQIEQGIDDARRLQFPPGQPTGETR